MEESAHRAIAIVGAGAVLPDAVNVPAFWENIKAGRYSISEVMPERWDPELYYDPDPNAPDKTYSKIGGWVRDFTWDPVKWRLPIPPRVIAAMDGAQQWAIACVREALEDYGYPNRPLDTDRTAVILGNAMAGEKHYFTALRLYFPDFARELDQSKAFAGLPPDVRDAIIRELHHRLTRRLPEVTEDTMPGELANCIAGRIANIFNLHGPNYVTDAACASAMAAISSAVDGLIENDFDLAITGGVDRNMGASTFIKFCKIGALSATGTRPYAQGADGFVMGEGVALFLLKRLSDAEGDGDKIYAVLRGMGGSSDGKGKGITAPNPVGQRLCVERAWKNAGLSPATVTLIEGHGTSTRVGDVVEVQSMSEVLGSFNLRPGSVALGSVKSNIGHLKGAAGAAGMLKVALALRDKVLPPSVHCERPNPDIDFAHSPMYVNTQLRPWEIANGTPRRAGVSAFGFGGTNFHAVLEEYIPGRLNGNGKRWVAAGEPSPVTANPGENSGDHAASLPNAGFSTKAPVRGALVIGATSQAALAERLASIRQAAEAGRAPAPAAPAERDLRAPERLAIDYETAADLADKSAKALKAFSTNQPATWKALRSQGIFRGSGPAPKVAFLYTGQGSQYVNMLKTLRAAEPIVAETFAEADRVMTPLLGKPLSEFIFVDGNNSDAIAKAEENLRQTAITQPAVLATDMALTRLLAAYGIVPDITMGHSLGEYGALIAAGGLPFGEALEAVSARGREMTRVSMADTGRMAAVFAPLAEIERRLKTIDGYVVIANINSESQAVIGGASAAVNQAVEMFQKAGYNAVPLPVSHAFHTSIVAPASEPLRQVLKRLHLTPPPVPVIANVSGEFYPAGPNAGSEMLDILARQVAAPVQFVKGLRTLYGAGVRVFVEVGPKKALQGFVDDVLGSSGDVASVFTNHPKSGDLASFNQALCALYAAGLGRGVAEPSRKEVQPPAPRASSNGGNYADLGRYFAEVLERGWQIYHGESRAAATPPVITGAALGLPGTERIFDDANIGRILRGEQFIDVIPNRFRRAILDKRITRLMKSDNGGPTFETIDSVGDVIKLAGRGGAFDLEKEFGVSAERIPALDRVTRLAIAVGLDALRDAGIPLVMRYKSTSKGTKLPDRWMLPEALRDDTGIIFASCWPGLDSFAEESARYYADQSRREQLALLESLRVRAAEGNGHGALIQALDHHIQELRTALEKEPYVFDRRFVFRTLAMGHSQFAEFIGARGPDTQVNSACASTTQAVSVAQDWIRSGRCRRVVVIAADDVTSDHLLEWLGSGFLATGAAATDEVVEETALPFDRRRHGLILGMGAAGLVIESPDAARERGIRPICEVVSSVTANSAFHGSRLDVEHISQVMEKLTVQAEASTGIPRQQMAPRMVFVSHETYTPARGGSASAEVHALRHVFGSAADQIVIANTKGFTGHAMGAGIEDVVAVKALETGWVPPVANFKEVDPELGPLNLSKGGIYPVEFALRLGAGFGSQISMTLLRTNPAQAVRRGPDELGYSYRIEDAQTWSGWLARVADLPSPNLEVVNRTLRVRDHGLPARVAEAPQESRPMALSPTLRATPLPAPVVAPAPVASESTADPVKDQVLNLVAAKTGYPADMLDLDLDLEADLGVDTVKQAEVFAAVRETYDIPRDEKLKLRDFPTLAHVIRFVRERRPDLAGRAPETPAPVVEQQPAPPPASDGAAGSVKARILELVAEKTGYPQDMLDLDLDLEADLGIDTVKQAEMFAAIREAYNIPRDETRKLRDYPTLAHVIRFVLEKRPDLVTPAAVPDVPAVAVADDPVRDKILEIAAGKTGYPKEMLDLDLDLEADLGIDTVKQAEMFAAIREAYNIPRDETRKLRDYPTLAHVIAFVREKCPDLVTQAAVPAVPAAATDDPVRDRILAIVAEKTGYPKEMLDLDLDLEADLGIDTVKQAELFASVRAAYNIPRDAELKLRDFPTLAHVIQFAHQRQSQQAPAQVSADAAPAAVGATPPVLAGFEAADRVPRRVPVPVARPPLAVSKPTGVQLGAGNRVVLMADRGGVGEALSARLRDLGVEVLSIEPGVSVEDLSARLQSFSAAGPVTGVYWLPALDDEGSLDEMDLAAWRDALRIRAKGLYVTMRALYERVAAAGTFLVSATRMGGQHGYNESGAGAPMGGAVTGFTKTYKRERPEVLVKAVDFEAECGPSEVAELLIQETLRDPGAVEIGYGREQRWTVGLREQPAADGQPGMRFGKDTVFLITGAAGSIVSAITADLAAASGGTFYLLDLAPEPQAGDPDLARFVSDRDGLKRDLFARIQARGERATPALVERELQTLERIEAARRAIDAVRAAGGAAQYFSVNILDPDAVAGVIGEVRARGGRIDVLLHAAGIERSHFLPDKDPREFDLVFDVKSDGWFNLLRAIGDMPLGATVAFSSIAGRFGNAGQSDYSSANDLLCKIASGFRSTRPATRAIAIDWTAWAGIGMAARGSIPKMMELAGIDMLAPEAGVPLIRRELTAGGTRGEVVIAGRLGILMKEFDADGGVDPNAAEAAGSGPMIGRVAAAGIHGGLRIETELDPAVQAFLHDHQIDGTPVLPGVMGIEAFAETASWLLPGWRVDAVEDVNFLAPFKFYRHERRRVLLEAVAYPAGESVTAECRLAGRRTLPNQAEPQETTHFTARVRLSQEAARPIAVTPPGPAAGSVADASAIYRLYFHGPAYQVLERAWLSGDQVVGLMAEGLPEDHQPAGRPMLMAPRLIELCLQTAGIWEMGLQKRMALPHHIDRVRFYRSPEVAEGRLYAVVTPHAVDASFDAEVVDTAGNCYVTLTGYRTVALPAQIEADLFEDVQAATA